MASNRHRVPVKRRDSISSTISLWDKLPEATSAPVDIADDNDFLDENEFVENDSEEEPEILGDEIISSGTLSKRFPSSVNLNNLQESSSLWSSDQYDQIKLIVHGANIEEARIELQRRLSNLRIRWVENNDKQIHSWYFGLSLIRFELDRLYPINIMRLIPIQSFPFWLRFKRETQKKRRVLFNSERIKPIRYGYPPRYRVSLRYGALTKLDQFHYSPEHSWSNEPKTRWSLFINNEYRGGSIEWVMEGEGERKKKQLLAMNIDHTVIVHLLPDGFSMYICQTCNMNEFSAKENHKTILRDHRPRPNPTRHSGPMRPSFDNNRLPQRISYEKDKRLSVRNGIYFPTIQFEVRIDLNHLNNEKTQNIVRQTYKLLDDFFVSHNIPICHGTIISQQGPSINSFPTMKLPTLIMRYSWQMLINIGYRLQVQIDKRFRDDLYLLSNEKYNADDLFYRVCVYLSRLFTLEPFVNLSNMLHETIKESKRKREEGAFGLISSLNVQDNRETYVPSVTLTPTTIRIKPFKLCRTNRVLRAQEEFGKAILHFALVDIRDENGQPLQSFHFRDLREHYLDYLNNGFTLMENNRYYQYLHHSQSQLRARQFWFYHHEPGLNRSFDKAYEWMGNFDRERNVAKNAARIALCFSTTIPTIDVNNNEVRTIQDIKTKDGKLTFTDGCGTISKDLIEEIRKELGKAPFSAVQFRYAGAKGVVSVDPLLGSGRHLRIRPSMDKFVSPHRCFEVCKVSAPRSLYLNRQAIILLSHRQISDATFLIFQQRNHLSLIRALLRNDDAKNLLDEKLPYWLLPFGAKIDFVREPFFRQLLITACLSSTRELLRRTRIRVSRNKARNMFGIIDEYNVLGPNEVFVQYTRMNDYEDNNKNEKHNKTQILDKCKVVITKNPCHHPGDVRTFTAVNHEALRHLKDVIVFSQQGDSPAPHQISGSDLDGDEYAVIWHEDLVPLRTRNETPYDYDSQTQLPLLDRPVNRDDINDTVLEIAESDHLGRLSNLHLAYSDRYGVNSNERPQNDVYSTIKLAGKISEEVDSGKTGIHPFNDMEIMQQSKALGNKRPDFMENANKESYRSEKILGKLYRSSRKTLPAWNRLTRRHRHLRHLEIRTPDDQDIIDEDEQQQRMNNNDDDQNTLPMLDSSLLNTNQSGLNHEMSVIASQLFFVYRQELLEILNLYGLSHESDLWCRNKTSNMGGELEDTAYTQLEQLVVRTRNASFLRLLCYCENPKDICEETTPFDDLCDACKKHHNLLAAALYRECYTGQNGSERAPILSLPWLFTTALLQTRKRELPPIQGLLSIAMKDALQDLINNHRLRLGDMTLTFCTSNNYLIEATVHWTVIIFVEILHHYIEPKRFNLWLMVLSRFIRDTNSFECKSVSSQRYNQMDEWSLVFDNAGQNKSYATILTSMEWRETDDDLMHSYFIQLLDICFDLGQNATNDNDEPLRLSEEIILILQKVAIDGNFSTENCK